MVPTLIDEILHIQYGSEARSRKKIVVSDTLSRGFMKSDSEPSLDRYMDQYVDSIETNTRIEN